MHFLCAHFQSKDARATGFKREPIQRKNNDMLFFFFFWNFVSITTVMKMRANSCTWSTYPCYTKEGVELFKRFTVLGKFFDGKNWSRNDYSFYKIRQHYTNIISIYYSEFRVRRNIENGSNWDLLSRKKILKS